MAEIANSEIIDIINKYIENLSKEITINKVILFGSYAKNCADEYSDIDIAIISDDFSGNIEEDFVLAMKACKNVDLRIEPHIFTVSDFENDCFSDEILKYGIEVYKVA